DSRVIRAAKVDGIVPIAARLLSGLDPTVPCVVADDEGCRHVQPDEGLELTRRDSERAVAHDAHDATGVRARKPSPYDRGQRVSERPKRPRTDEPSAGLPQLPVSRHVWARRSGIREDDGIFRQRIEEGAEEPLRSDGRLR